MLVVGTYRDTDVAPGSPLTRLGGGADRVGAARAGRGEVAGLLADAHRRRAGRRARGRGGRLTGGNPFLVVQIGRLLATTRTRSATGALPTGARDLLEQRLAFAASRRPRLLVARRAGQPVPAADVERVTSAAEGAPAPGDPVTRAAVDRPALARAAGLRIVERAAGTGTWAFVHDLFRRAALEALIRRQVAGLHRAAAEALQAPTPSRR